MHDDDVNNENQPFGQRTFNHLAGQQRCALKVYLSDRKRGLKSGRDFRMADKPVTRSRLRSLCYGGDVCEDLNAQRKPKTNLCRMQRSNHSWLRSRCGNAGAGVPRRRLG